MRTLYTIILICFSLVLLLTNYSCKTQAICGMFYPTHKISFENDSVFKYSKWYLDTDTNSFGFNSEGLFSKIDKNTYILNSYDFNPDSIKTDYKFETDTMLSGFRVRVTTELGYEDFDFHYGKLYMVIDSLLFKFTRSTIDTIFHSHQPERIKLQFIAQPDSVIPKSLLDCYTSIPIDYIPDTINYVQIYFPISAKYYNWYHLDDNVLYKRGKGKKSRYFLWGDNWPVNLDIE